MSDIDLTKPSGPPSDEAMDSDRREALKRFGRYAAAAPTAMLLLGPRPVEAQESTDKKDKKDKKDKDKKGGDGDYD